LIFAKLRIQAAPKNHFFTPTCTSKIGEKSLSQKYFVFGLPWHAEFGSEKFKKNHFSYPI
jgi:hypothetical protein